MILIRNARKNFVPARDAYEYLKHLKRFLIKAGFITFP